MKKYRFILKIGALVKSEEEMELADMEKALLCAEAFLSTYLDSFVDSVTFFEVKEGYTYQVVYRIEKCHELSENIGL